MDVINCAKFYHKRLRGLDFVRGQILTNSHRKVTMPLTQGLNYHSACDGKSAHTEQAIYPAMP